jgi:Phage tail lysozyme
MSDKDWAGMKANPGQAQMIKNYLGAAGQNPSMALTYLKPFLDGRGDLMNQFYNGSEFGDVKGPQAGLLRSALTTSNNYAASIALQSGKDLPKVTSDRLATYRDRLSKDLGISREAASGVVGNLYDESGLQAINEKGGGGFGWAQWTGSRRTDFEAYAKTHGGATSDEANYGFLVQELQKPQFADVLKRLRDKDITYAEASDIIMKRYENPRNQSTSAMQGREQASGMVQGLPSGSDNVPTDVYGPTVNADQAAVGASRYAANTVGISRGAAWVTRP